MTISKNNARQLIRFNHMNERAACQLIALINHVLAHLCSKRKRRREEKQGGKKCTSRELTLVLEGAIGRIYSRRRESRESRRALRACTFRNGSVGGFIQLIGVVEEHAIRPRRTRPRGFRLAVGTRAQVECGFC